MFGSLTVTCAEGLPETIRKMNHKGKVHKNKKGEALVSPFLTYKNMADETVTLQIFDLVEKNPDISEGKITLQTGLAAGFVHSFMKRIFEKGWVRARKVTARRWLYFMTPEGFTEKSRLVVNYLGRTMESYKLARLVVSAQLEVCQRNGWHRVVVAGDNDVADIAALHVKATLGFELVGVVSRNAAMRTLNGVKVVSLEESHSLEYDRLWVCDAPADEWFNSRGEAEVPRNVDYIYRLMLAHYSINGHSFR